MDDVVEVVVAIYTRTLARPAFGSKRLFDLAVSSAALLVTGPVILLGALAVKLTSPGPAFYRAKRAGLSGRPFAMLKLRSMRVGLDSVDRRVTAEHDDRITRVGAFLRKTKIDELPEFWNVLRGDMSIIGPRPEDFDIVEQHYTPEQRRILDARPGIASPVDVDWYPDMTYHDPPPAGADMQQWYLDRHHPVQVAEGIRYLERQSLLLDLTVMARLIGTVIVHSFVAPKKRPLPGVTDPNRDREGAGRERQPVRSETTVASAEAVGTRGLLRSDIRGPYASLADARGSEAERRSEAANLQPSAFNLQPAEGRAAGRSS